MSFLNQHWYRDKAVWNYTVCLAAMLPVKERGKGQLGKPAPDIHALRKEGVVYLTWYTSTSTLSAAPPA